MANLEGNPLVKKVNTRDLYRYYRANKGTLSYDLFKKVISMFNQSISVEVMNGYHFRMPYFLGVIKIIENPRHFKINKNGNIKGAINWGESNKIKQEIIDRGGIPFKLFKDENNNKTGDNGGEKWMIYFTDDVYYCWIRLEEELLHNGTWYTFSPTWTNSRALKACLPEDAELIFHRGKLKKDMVRFNVIFDKPIKVKESNFDLCSQ